MSARTTLRHLMYWLLLGAATQLTALEELHLRNGDRLTGQLLRREDGKIVFQSDFIGVVTINETDGAVIELPDTPVESLAGLPPSQPPSRVEKSPAVAATPKPDAPPPPVAVTTPPQKAKGGRDRWKGKLEFGFLDQSGRNYQTSLSIRGEAERKVGPKNQLRVEGRTLYAKTKDTVTNDRQDAMVRWRRDLTSRMFAQLQSSYLANEVQDIDFNAEQNFGLGYRLLDEDRHVLNLGGGVTAQYRESELYTDGWAYLMEAFQDYTWKLNGRFTIRQNANVFYSPPEFGSRNLVAGNAVSTAGSFRFRLNSSLQGKVTERISMNLRVEFEHDATIEDEELRDDRRITSSIGYAF